jgi:hypothetical protein
MLNTEIYNCVRQTAYVTRSKTRRSHKHRRNIHCDGLRSRLPHVRAHTHKHSQRFPLIFVFSLSPRATVFCRARLAFAYFCACRPPARSYVDQQQRQRVRSYFGVRAHVGLFVPAFPSLPVLAVVAGLGLAEEEEKTTTLFTRAQKLFCLLRAAGAAATATATASQSVAALRIAQISHRRA